MWEKQEDDNSRPESPRLEKSPVKQLKERTIIGPSIIIKGTVAGKEDLMIQGEVEGGIDSKENNITVGQSGHIKGDIHGKNVSIEGKVQGNLVGEERIVIRQCGRVCGDLRAPRINLEDGAKYKGNVATDSNGEEKQSTLKEFPLAQERNAPTKS